MPLVPVKLPVGMKRKGTDYENANTWRDCNLIRWSGQSIRPVGGWQQFADASGLITAPPRCMHAWVDNNSDSKVAFGTANELIFIGGGGIVSDITPTGLTAGSPDATQNLGYGGQFYGAGLYGTARISDGTVNEADIWKLDNWGEFLVGCSTADGRLFEWQLDTGVEPASIAGSPTNCKGVLVTEERFLVAVCANGNPRLLAWSDREDNTTWTPAVDNEAGDFELQTTGEIMTCQRTNGGFIVVTTVDAHMGYYQGAPFVYGFRRLGSACGTVSRNAVVDTDKGVFWMGREAFFYSDGNGVTAMSCDVEDYVFEDLNSGQATKVYGLHNSEYGEVWWFYPSDSSIECDRYVSYNYIGNYWAFGQIDRCAGVDQGVYVDPIWVSPEGIAYFQEKHGFPHGSVFPFIETGPLSIGNGDNVAHVNSVITDELTQGDVQIKFKTRFHPNDVEREYGAYAIDGHPTSVRVTGRQIRMRLEATNNDDFRIGSMRLNVVAGGKR